MVSPVPFDPWYIPTNIFCYSLLYGHGDTKVSYASHGLVVDEPNKRAPLNCPRAHIPRVDLSVGFLLKSLTNNY